MTEHADNLQSLQLDKRRLRDRIKKFYVLLNEQNWESCFKLIDPKLRDAGKVAFDSYAATLSAFFGAFGPLEDVSVSDLKLYSDVKSKLYGDRDFAYGCVVCKDREHHPQRLEERWVKATDGRWYTLMVGLV
ncbi:MAG: hypothetical protein HY000_20770 [Planctomycetes bacterium]|nr:hypothetical protein [Planctomycetota bacterium]